MAAAYCSCFIGVLLCCYSCCYSSKPEMNRSEYLPDLIKLQRRINVTLQELKENCAVLSELNQSLEKALFLPEEKQKQILEAASKIMGFRRAAPQTNPIERVPSFPMIRELSDEDSAHGRGQIQSHKVGESTLGRRRQV